jgi:chitinase
MFSQYGWRNQQWRTSPATPYPQSIPSVNYEKRQAVKSVLRGEAYYVEDDHYDAPEQCLIVDDGEGGMYCLPDQYVSEDHHDLHEHPHKRHHQHHHYHTAPIVTSTTLDASAPSNTEHTEARGGVRSPGPIQTAAA